MLLYLLNKKVSDFRSQGAINQSDTLSASSIAPETEKTTTTSRYSIDVDTTGRELSEGQKEFFKDFKIRDAACIERKIWQ